MSMRKPSAGRLPQRIARNQVPLRLKAIKLPRGLTKKRLFREALAEAVDRYFETPSMSEYASAVRKAYSANSSLPTSVADYAPPGLNKEEKLTAGFVVALKGGRKRPETLLVGQTGKGFPGREPEKILVASLASAWAGGGLKVVSGSELQRSPFETLVEDVFVALLIDNSASAPNLVRAHIKSR